MSASNVSTTESAALLQPPSPSPVQSKLPPPTYAPYQTSPPPAYGTYAPPTASPQPPPPSLIDRLGDISYGVRAFLVLQISVWACVAAIYIWFWLSCDNMDGFWAVVAVTFAPFLFYSGVLVAGRVVLWVVMAEVRWCTGVCGFCGREGEGTGDGSSGGT